MPKTVVRFATREESSVTGWAIRDGERFVPLRDAFATTGDLVEAFDAGTLVTSDGEAFDLDTVDVLSPVTRNHQFVCQGANYRLHMIESGMNPDDKSYNMIFTKARSSISAPGTDVIRPPHVKFLDYEIELGLILRRPIDRPCVVTEANLGEYVAGAVIVNDYSARDVQIPQTQFHKGKSYRTFGPVGPYLVLLEPDEVAVLNDLDLRLTVNGEVRQNDSTANLVFKPWETLTELSGVQDFEAGDLLSTGTPAGCAFSAPAPAVVKAVGLLPEKTKWALFNSIQAKRPFLQPGDVVEASIVSGDGSVDLGVQRNRIVSASSSTAAAGIANRADIERIEAGGWPDQVPSSTYEMLKFGALRNPSAPALSFFLTVDELSKPQTWTYSELVEEVTRTANAFHGLGATKDTVIAYVLPNLPETHFVIWGGQAAGIVFAINPLLDAETIAELLRAANASIVVTLAPFPGTDLWSKVGSAIRSVPSVKHVVTVNMADRVAGPKGMAAHLLAKREEYAQCGLRGVQGVLGGIKHHEFRELVRSASSSALASGRTIGSDDLSSYFCTGGTTGLPKIAMRTHGNEVSNVISAQYALGGGIAAGKNIFCGLPLFHVNAVTVTGLIPFYLGAHVVLGPPQGYRSDGLIDRFWEIVERHQIHFFSGVPTLYSSLLQVPIGAWNISSLEYGLCGAAPLPVELMTRFQEATGVKILEGYGLTEATCVSSGNPPMGERRTGSIGLRVPFQRMKVVALDEHGAFVRDCKAGQVGTIVISGPNVFSGYRIAEQNQNLWIDLGDDHKWLNTGDLGRQDADGYFWLTGRKKELIIRGGHNIDPAQIETPLYSHPEVQYVAAVGRPDVHAGELPVAYVQLKPGGSVTAAELEKFSASKIGERAARPKTVHLIEDMPLTAVGKIFKPDLVRREIRSAAGAALQRAGVTATLDLSKEAPGMPATVEVCVSGHDQIDEVNRVLGEFTFPFTVHLEG